MRDNIYSFMKSKLDGYENNITEFSYGTVVKYADEVVYVKGLSDSLYDEIVEFENGAYGLALDFDENGIKCVLLSGGDTLETGMRVRGTGHIADIAVGDKLLGRVVDPLGRPIDGEPLEADEFRRDEQRPPEIMQRSAVCRPVDTGLLAIDSMIPIGRGQRELIIGDRQTGKTTMAVDMILNQKDKGMYCIYCAISQKASTVANVVHKFKENGAMKYTTVVAAFANDSVALQYLAPYAACSIAEKMMYDGKDVLVVYDDLSKHAVAYRTMSLLLKRPSGREAFPGDIFYLHSRLLERSAKLSDELGGGSMTAIPIVETQAGDISAYIPTNVISITDGQIYLESELFNAGVRPAVNVGLSVSRVGRNAQSKAMKDVSAGLRIDLARYREMAVFTQFGSDIDQSTSDMLAGGQRLTELLKQKADEMLSLSDEVITILASKENIFNSIDIKKVNPLRKDLIAYVKQKATSNCHNIENNGAMSEDDRKNIVSAMKDWLTEYGKHQ